MMKNTMCLIIVMLIALAVCANPALARTTVYKTNFTDHYYDSNSWSILPYPPMWPDTYDANEDGWGAHDPCTHIPDPCIALWRVSAASPTQEYQMLISFNYALSFFDIAEYGEIISADDDEHVVILTYAVSGQGQGQGEGDPNDGHCQQMAYSDTGKLLGTVLFDTNSGEVKLIGSETVNTGATFIRDIWHQSNVVWKLDLEAKQMSLCVNNYGTGTSGGGTIVTTGFADTSEDANTFRTFGIYQHNGFYDPELGGDQWQLGRVLSLTHAFKIETDVDIGGAIDYPKYETDFVSHFYDDDVFSLTDKNGQIVGDGWIMGGNIEGGWYLIEADPCNPGADYILAGYSYNYNKLNLGGNGSQMSEELVEISFDIGCPNSTVGGSTIRATMGYDYDTDVLGTIKVWRVTNPITGITSDKVRVDLMGSGMNWETIYVPINYFAWMKINWILDLRNQIQTLTINDDDANSVSVAFACSDCNELNSFWVSCDLGCDGTQIDNLVISCPYCEGDINRDCYVNFTDFSIEADNWAPGVEQPLGVKGLWYHDGDLNDDRYVDVNDLVIIVNNWLECRDPQPPCLYAP